MSMPFYVAPEQWMKDKADYARKGIARGRALAALEFDGGIVICAENSSTTLRKISEIYDRIAFAGAGRYNEYDRLRIAGVRHADLKGFSFSREDVDAQSLANAYAQMLGDVFTHEVKPLEVEILVAEVGRAPEDNRLFHVLYDGTVSDEKGYSVLGGEADVVSNRMEANYEHGLSLSAALQVALGALGGSRQLTAKELEVAVLEQGRSRRSFRRLAIAEIAELIGDEAVTELAESEPETPVDPDPEAAKPVAQPTAKAAKKRAKSKKSAPPSE